MDPQLTLEDKVIILLSSVPHVGFAWRHGISRWGRGARFVPWVQALSSQLRRGLDLFLLALGAEKRVLLEQLRLSED